MRYLLASVPYRKKLNFTFDGLKAAATSIDRLRNYKLRLETDKFPDGTNAALAERTRAAASAFDAALDDDLNTAEALAAVFEYIRDTNTAMDAGEFPAGNVPAALEFLDRFDSVFDVLKPSARAGGLCGCRSGRAHRRTHRRQESRRISPVPTRFATQLAAQGVILEDTKEGVRWKRS